MRKIIRKGYVVFTPLSYSFQMIEQGGSNVQQYDYLNGEYEPDRSITPFILQPKLDMYDEDGRLSNGDVSTFLRNVIWKVQVEYKGEATAIDEGDNTYRIDRENGYKLTLYRNCELGERILISFRADYVDERRNDTQRFEWSGVCTCQEQTQLNMLLSLNYESKVRVSVFKLRPSMSITAKVTNGEADITDKADITWEFWNGSKYVPVEGIENSEDVDYYPLWLDENADIDVLNILPKHITNLIIRCTAKYKDVTKTKTIKLVRWYGQYWEEMHLLSGQFYTTESKVLAAELELANRKGIIRKPTKYFDLQIMHSTDNINWLTVSHTQEYEERKEDLTKTQHYFGAIVRELTAEIPLLAPDGKALEFDGKILTVIVPEE